MKTGTSPDRVRYRIERNTKDLKVAMGSSPVGPAMSALQKPLPTAIRLTSTIIVKFSASATHFVSFTPYTNQVIRRASPSHWKSAVWVKRLHITVSKKSWMVSRITRAASIEVSRRNESMTNGKENESRRIADTEHPL